MGNSYIRHVGPAGGYLVARSFHRQFMEAWFEPGFWGERAVPVTHGGRGSAWFLQLESGDLVLRHFCRGGVPGRVIHRGYFYTRADAVRSFAEFRLLDTLRKMDLPVPEPVAAGYRCRGPIFYHASIIIRRIPGAKPLSRFASNANIGVWKDAGACVRRFHDAGVFHADLNVMNILVSDQVYLIDFDRGRVMQSGRSGRWKASNIARLERSVNKSLADLDAGLRDQLWQAFLAGYRPE
ncbi:3-deoxy-D-manno-octulosonic acid kinase [Marinobacter sp.]|uniref:3-deoxy-D-manno-octulosonic acid kinase n=1 Tax=Marinobacter sp. TaxID=50741 RepID=UPI0034A12A98